MAQAGEKAGERLAPARGLGHNEHTAGETLLELTEDGERIPRACVDRHCRRQPCAERNRLRPAAPGKAAQFDAAEARTPAEKLLGRVKEFGRGQQRALDVVTSLFVAFTGFLPESAGQRRRVVGQDDDAVAAEVLEQALRGFVEERQIVLPAGAKPLLTSR
jgi:hypothetical protein